jgi:hypothetical protein
MKQRAVEERATQREAERNKQAQHGATEPVVQTEEELDEIDRGAMETVMAEMSERMGIVHLGSLMEALSDRVDKLQNMLENPKSLVSRLLLTLFYVSRSTISSLIHFSTGPEPRACLDRSHKNDSGSWSCMPNCCIAPICRS